MSTGRMKREDDPKKEPVRRPDISSAEEAQRQIRALRGNKSPSCLQQLAHRLTGRKPADKKNQRNSSGSQPDIPED